MWFFLWIVLSAVLIGATLWSLQILLRQKTAWEKYAKDKGFVFRKGTVMGPAEMTGKIGDYTLSFFTAERATEDARAKRYVTVLEINLKEGLIDGGAAGTKEMLPFIHTLDKLQPFKIEQAEWDREHHLHVKFVGPAQAYWTAERIDTLSQLLKTRNADVILVFNHEEVVVRLETSDPMQDADKIDKIVKRTLALIGKLRIPAEQRAQYMAQTVAADLSAMKDTPAADAAVENPAAPAPSGV